jgi:hypothetical protein
MIQYHACYAEIDSKEEQWATYTKGVWYSRVWATNGVFARWQVTSGKQTKGRQEHAGVVAKAQSDLASVGSLSKGGDTSAIDVAVVSHGVESRAIDKSVCDFKKSFRLLRSRTPEEDSQRVRLPKICENKGGIPRTTCLVHLSQWGTGTDGRGHLLESP